MNLTQFQATESNVNTQYYFTGPLQEPQSLTLRLYTLASIVRVGCTLDCRDFFGKWYEAEVLKLSSEPPFGVHSESVNHTRILVHYLGYSSSYDEWFDLGNDMSRIAFAGTHTVGPNLRTLRRTAQSYPNGARPRGRRLPSSLLNQEIGNGSQHNHRAAGGE